MKFYIYQSPKREKKRSAPVREDEAARRQILEQQGWTIVEVQGEDGHAVPVLGVIKDPQEARKLVEVTQPPQPAQTDQEPTQDESGAASAPASAAADLHTL